MKFLVEKYNLEEIDKKIGDNFWSPVDVAKVNDWILRAAAFKGEFNGSFIIMMNYFTFIKVK